LEVFIQPVDFWSPVLFLLDPDLGFRQLLRNPREIPSIDLIVIQNKLQKQQMQAGSDRQPEKKHQFPLMSR
jgi:hypothetical protein